MSVSLLPHREPDTRSGNSRSESGSESRPAVEVPSGKHADYENFPVGSWLLPARLRPHILTFYAFARAIDDIADTPTLSPSEKLERLGTFARVVRGGPDEPGYETAAAMAKSLARTGVTARHCLDLIAAFRHDADNSRYADWDALMAYCMLSAAPVGRYLIDLHGGSSDGYASSDALCCSLQVINHLQDCGDDYQTLGRIYLPGNWMTAEGAEAVMLSHPVTSPELRRVLDRTLQATDTLLEKSLHVSAGLHSRRLGMEAAIIQRIAEALAAKLRAEDPLAGRVSLGRFRYSLCGVLGGFDGVFRARKKPRGA